LKRFLALPNAEIILSGAGSSAFVGEMLAGTIQQKTGITTRAIPTTDLVTHPASQLKVRKNVLLVSFARSGNSPESMAAVNLANTLCPGIHHLAVTCNRDGFLAKHSEWANYHALILPEETNDQSLAMTSSVTGMYVATLLAFDAALGLFSPDQAKVAADCTIAVFAKFEQKIAEVVKSVEFNRIVFLGSGPMLGAAHEAHLKVQELTDGTVVGKFDSFLGFRHGPRVVANPTTLVVFMLSNDPYAAKYELDLVKSVRDSQPVGGLICLSEIPVFPAGNLNVVLSAGGKTLKEEYLPPIYLVLAQLIGFYASLKLGYNPDSPSKSGVITRVVSGVEIYQYPA